MTINSISCKLIEKRGKKAEIEIEGNKILVDVENLPARCQSGDQLQLYFVDEKTGKLKEKELARTILEEILNGG